VRSDGLSTRALLRMVGVLFAVLAGLYLLWLSRGVITWLAIGAFLAVAINPLVTAMQDRLRMRRAPAIFVVYLAIAGLVTGAALLFVPPLIEAGQQLTEEVPTYVERLSESDLVQRLDEEYDILDRLEEEATSALGGVAGPDTAVELATRVVNGLVALISIGVIAFLISLYGPRAHAWVMAQQQGERRERLQRVSDRVYRVISGYVVGIFLVALTGGVAVWIFLTITDVPFALLLAFWAGLASLVPLVGATIGGIPYIIVAFFQGWPIGVAAIVFLIVYQQIENNVFQPVIHRFTVQLNALWIILAVLIGATLLGVVGALMAIPAAGITQVLIQEWWAARHDTTPPPLPAQEPAP
jgi:predicted PurR-regulated permease PerM